MSVLRLYFQYTHLSNVDVTALRAFINGGSGKMQLISSKSLLLGVPVAFGKLLVVTLPTMNFTFNFVTELLAKFNMLRLLFINYDSFILSPALYMSYMNNKLSSVNNIKLYCLSFVLNSLFQEKFLYKYTSQYIC
jgi:hypothetical protein